MDQDFEIEILAISGLSSLGKYLRMSPISLAMVEVDSGDVVLKQNEVSQIAGVAYESRKGDVYVFSMCVLYKSPMPAKTLVSQFSQFLKAASLPHRITEILHEVDFDEEWISYQWPANT